MSSDTRDKLIGATVELMLRRGYGGTGINDICGHAGVSKGAFYHLFPSKEAITLGAMQAFYEGGIEAMRDVNVSDAPAEDRMIAFVERVAELAPVLWRDGCLLGGLATEMAACSDVLQADLSKQFTLFTEFVESLAEPFVGTLDGVEMTPTDLAEDFLAAVEGAIVLSRAHRDPTRIRAALKRFALRLRHLPAKSEVQPNH